MDYLKNLTFIFILFILTAFFSFQSVAQNFTVTSNGDTHAASPTTSPNDAGGQITLRSAMEASTQIAGTHIITIPAAIGATINLTLGQMTVGNAAVGNNITVSGPGMNSLTVNQTTENRIFSTGTGAVTFLLQDITLNYTGPAVTAYSGGGGAIIAGGAGAVTTLLNCRISNFQRQIGNGGAISASSSLNSHSLNITNCVFTNNRCGGAGGAVSFNSQGGTATISGCTFDNNHTGPVGANTGGDGGAVSTTGGGSGGTYLIEKNTFLNNQVENVTGHAGAVMNTNGTLTLRYNRFIGNICANVSFPPLANIVGQAGGATIHVTIADNNWWGVNTGPGANDATALAAGAVMTLTKWLQLKHTASPSSVNVVAPGNSTTLTASFLSNSANEAIAVGNLSTLIGLPVTFNNALKGSISLPQTTIQASGTATATFTADPAACPPPGSADAKVDNATATASIIIVDNIPPTITCSGPATVSCASEATPDIASVTATDNCPPVTVTWQGDVITNQTCTNRYTITRTYRATDAAGNTAECTQTITVNDITPPTITCVAQTTPINCPAAPVFVAPSVSDNCGGLPTVTFSDVTTPGTCPGTYNVTRTWTATDDCGNSSTCSRAIVVQDVTPPTITCAAQTTPINCPATPVFAAPTVTDACDASPTVTFNDEITPGSCLGTYSVTRTWIATDDCGNTSSCSSTIVVQDVTAPTITCSAQTTPINCPATPVFAAPTVTDACDASPTVTFNDVTTPGSCPGTYSVTRTWTATDDCGNSSSCSRTIVVQDNTPPSITCKAQTTPINCPATPVFEGPTAIDNCDASVTITFIDITTPGTGLTKYSVTRTWTATDDCGNTATCSRTIVVQDIAPPQITCPADITVIESPAGSGTAIVNFSVTATDICDGALTSVSVPASGSAFPIGETIVVSTATDASGNSASCTFKVIIQSACQIACPPDMTVNTLSTNLQCGTIVTYPAATTTGDCGPLTYSKASGSFFDVGETTVTVSSPSTGQSCTFKVTVVDNTIPIITCPAPITVNNDPGTCGAVVTYSLPVASDNCGLIAQPVTQTINYSGSIVNWTVPAGVTYITITAKGAEGGNYNSTPVSSAGKGASMKGTFPVSPGQQLKLLVGGQPLGWNNGGGGTFVTDLSNIPLIVAGGGGGSSVGLDNPAKHGLVGTSGGASGNSSCNSPGGTGGNGGGASGCGSNYVGGGGGFYTDGQTGSGLIVPGKAFVNGGAGGFRAGFPQAGFGGGGFGSGGSAGGGGGGYSGGGAAWFFGAENAVGGGGGSYNAGTTQTNIAGDNTGNGIVTITYAGTNTIVQTAGLPPGATFPVGTTTNTFKATDVSGNISTCSFMVTVTDNQPPIITTGTVVSCYPTAAAAEAAAIAATTATDNCPGVLTETASTVGTCSAVITVTVTDANNNSAATTYNTRIDNTAPTVTVGTIGSCYPTVAAAEAAALAATSSEDNCPGTLTETASTVGTCSAVVTVTTTDGCGNATAVTYNTRIDNTAPIPPVFAQVLLEYKCISDVPTAPAVNGTDNCDGIVPGVLVLTNNGGTGCVSSPLIITRTWTFTDLCGNSSTAVQTVKVIDDVAPTITGESANPTCLWPPNHKMKDVYIGYTASDNCKVTTTLTVSSNEPINGTGDGDVSPDWEIIDDHHVNLRAERAGTGTGRIYTITITATDGCNTTTKTVTVVVAHDITSPVSGASYKIGSTVNFSGTFWDKPGNTHTATWTIDNTSVKGAVTEPAGLKNGKVTGSYKFGSAGVYKLQMNVKDQTGVVSYANTNGDLDAIVVIYDPNGGYAFGGGYFMSPQGALKSNASATGKVSYGFNSNYFKGATNPKGETQMQFQVGNLEFNALNFDYLAISGAKAQFKGSGKIMGDQAGYNFIMTVIDGALNGTGFDKIRLKIFNKNTGGVIYDSQPAASDAADPTTVVANGSTVVIVNPNATTVTSKAITSNTELIGFPSLQSYPNPFSSSTTIRYVLPKDAHVSLSVYDNLGQKVGLLVEGRMPAGSYYVRFNASKLPGGLYICRLLTVDATGKQVVLNGKMTIVR